MRAKNKLPGLLGALAGGSLERRVMRLLETRLPWARRWRVMSAVGCAVVMGVACAGGVLLGMRAQERPEFEAATIKPVVPNVPHTIELHVYPGGRLVVHTVSLKGLILDAFNLSYWQVSGGEDWVDKLEYDVEAQPAEAWRPKVLNAQLSWYGIQNEYERQMLQVLLQERFQLKFHRESKPGTVDVLERSKSALRLQPSKEMLAASDPDNLPVTGQVGRVSGRGTMLTNMSMTQLAKFLSDYVLHKPVSDGTRLDGYFDFKSEVILTDEDIYNNDPMALIPVLHEMGLELKQEQGTVETFVIDSAQRPTEN